MATKGQAATRATLAEFFGVALTTVDGWVRSGCPVVQRGARGVEWKFNTAAVAKWLQDRAREEGGGKELETENTLKRRKLAAEAEQAELALAKCKNEVALVAEFEHAWSQAMSAIRANVMNVPARAVQLLLGETNETEFKRKLRAELVLALETASTEELEFSDDELDELEAEE